jgi:hypothetical protein
VIVYGHAIDEYDRNPIQSAEMKRKFQIGADHLLDFLEKRMMSTYSCQHLSISVNTCYPSIYTNHPFLYLSNNVTIYIHDSFITLVDKNDSAGRYLNNVPTDPKATAPYTPFLCSSTHLPVNYVIDTHLLFREMLQCRKAQVQVQVPAALLPTEPLHPPLQ